MNDESAPKGAPETIAAVTESLFDSSLTGINRALSNSDSWQRDGFNRALQVWAERGVAFLIEDVIEDCGLPIDHHCRAGAWTNAAARAGIITRVGYAKAKRASRAAAVVAVWRGADHLVGQHHD